MNQCGDPVPGFPITKCIYGTFWDVPVVFHPLGSGGTEWSPSSYSQQTGFIYVTALERDSTLAVRQLPYTQGKTYTVPSARPHSARRSTAGTPRSNSRTNTIVWQKHEQFDQSYGSVSTAGGLVFRGKVDGNIEAYDAKTGDVLWTFETGLAISAPPMVWGDGTNEYVTVAVGGNRGGPSRWMATWSGPSA
jgi:outer membrane protein assembly factor BamB